MEPVEPRMARRFMGQVLTARASLDHGRPQIYPWCDEEQRVDPVEEPAVARDEPAGVLHPGRALQHRLAQVAERAQHGRAEAEPDAARPGEEEDLALRLRDDEEDRLHEERSQHA